MEVKVTNFTVPLMYAENVLHYRTIVSYIDKRTVFNIEPFKVSIENRAALF